MPRRRKTFPCGHTGFGRICHRCADKEKARLQIAEIKAEREALLATSSIPLGHLPAAVQNKAMEVMVAVASGRPWQEFKGKKITSRRGVRIVVPLGWSYRLLFQWDSDGRLLPEEAMTHEAYNGLFS